MKAPRKRVIWISLAVLAVAGIAAYELWPRQIEQPNIVEVDRSDIARTGLVSGKVQPVARIEIRSDAAGIVAKLPVHVGDVVHKGDVICELDRNQLLDALHEQETAVQIAENGVAEAQRDFDADQLNSEGRDVPYLKCDRDQARKLFASGVISRRDMDAANKIYETAAYKQQSAQLKLPAAEAALNEAKDALTRQRALYSLAVENLDNYRITSPTYGVVLSRDAKVGSSIESTRQAGPAATRVMTIGDLNEVYVQGQADPGTAPKLHLYQPARIMVETFREQQFLGDVRKISVRQDAKSNRTTSEVQVVIPNQRHFLDSRTSASAEIVLEEHRNVLAIPSAAIVHKKDKATVLVPDPDASKGYRSVAVVTGIGDGGRTEVLQGLSERQRVIVP